MTISKKMLIMGLMLVMSSSIFVISYGNYYYEVQSLKKEKQELLVEVNTLREQIEDTHFKKNLKQDILRTVETIRSIRPVLYELIKVAIPCIIATEVAKSLISIPCALSEDFSGYVIEAIRAFVKNKMASA